MDLSNSFSLFAFPVGICILLLGAYQYKFPYKHISSLHGCGVVVLIVAPVGLVVEIGEMTGVFSAMSFFLLSLLCMAIRTERALKQRFDDKTPSQEFSNSIK